MTSVPADAYYPQMERTMENTNNYQALEDVFKATFIDELLPGILHNFANPLNGIMGRSKLLQRRVDDAIKKVNEQYPETAASIQDDLQRIRNDIYSVNKESEAFHGMFRDVSGKFYALADKGKARINLAHLLTAEMRFADFYLEFKHEITKYFQADKDMPEIHGNLAELSLAMWRLIRLGMSRALVSEKKEFYLNAWQDGGKILIAMKYSGESLSDDKEDMIWCYREGDRQDLDSDKLEKGVLPALIALQKFSAQIQFSGEDGFGQILITLPQNAQAN